MWELDCEEGWAPKNWCFWTVVFEKTLESPLNCKEVQPVHPKADQSCCSLEGLMLKLKLQYFGHFMQRGDSLEKTLVLRGIGGRRKRGWQRMRWLDGITLNSRRWWWTGRPGVLQFMGSQRVRHDWATELNWTDKYIVYKYWHFYNILKTFSFLYYHLSICGQLNNIFQSELSRERYLSWRIFTECVWKQQHLFIEVCAQQEAPSRDFLDFPVVTTSSSSAGGVGSIPD